MKRPQSLGNDRRHAWRFWAWATVYGVWLLWLGYVAWINIQAGNQ